MTPITSNGRRDRLTVRPMIAGSAPSRVRQMRSLRMTRSAPPGRSSSSVNVLPSAARVPSSSKYPAVTNRPSRFSGPADPRNSWPSRIESGDAREGLGLLAKRVEVSRRQRHIDESRMLREDAHERVRVGVGQRFQQHAADDAVDGGVASDGQAERQDDDGRERRVLRETPRRPPVLAPDLAPTTRRRCAVRRPRKVAWLKTSLTERGGFPPGSSGDRAPSTLVSYGRGSLVSE